MLTRAAIKESIPRPVMFDKPVKIRFWFNSRLDVDNNSILVKFIIDSLKGWIIEDDSKKYVRSIEINCHTEDYILAIVEEIQTNEEV